MNSVRRLRAGRSTAFAFIVASAVTIRCGGGCNEPSQQRVPGSDAAAVAGDGLIVVTYDSVTADTFRTIGADSVTVLNRLRAVTDSAGLELVTREFPFGVLVTGIGGHREGGNWLYRVNGKMIPTGAHAHRVAPSDTVEFFFRVD